MDALESTKARLQQCGLVMTGSTRLTNNTGYQLRYKTGEIVNVFDNGNIQVQGKNTSQTKALLGLNGTPASTNATSEHQQKASPTPRKVFVVYGHDKAARNELEAMLLRWGLEPLILDRLPSEGQTIIEKLEKYTTTEAISFGVVLATPDDEGYPVGNPEQKKYRARQNVILELGLLLGQLGRSRVAVLIKQQDSMEKPSDIHGVIYLSFKDSVSEVAVSLAREMATQGISISVDKLY